MRRLKLQRLQALYFFFFFFALYGNKLRVYIYKLKEN